MEINLPLTRAISCGIYKGLQVNEANDWNFLPVMEGCGNVVIWNISLQGCAPWGGECEWSTVPGEQGNGQLSVGKPRLVQAQCQLAAQTKRNQTQHHLCSSTSCSSWHWIQMPTCIIITDKKKKSGTFCHTDAQLHLYKYREILSRKQVIKVGTETSIKKTRTQPTWASEIVKYQILVSCCSILCPSVLWGILHLQYPGLKDACFPSASTSPLCRFRYPRALASHPGRKPAKDTINLSHRKRA